MYKVKRFSQLGRTWHGIKGAGKTAGYGAVAGGLLSIPLAGFAALCGKYKASMIIAGIGAGLGAGALAAVGYSNAVSEYDYNQKLKNDPKFREAEMRKAKMELDKLIKNESISRCNSASDKKYFERIEDEFGVEFKPDLYKYVDFYGKFESRYRKMWAEAWKVLDKMEDIDALFNYIFPDPNPESSYWDLSEMSDNKDPIVVAGNTENSDHSWVLYDPNSGRYEFTLGGGHGSDSIAKTIGDFSKVWLADLTKIKDEKVRAVAEIHNKIINEFLNGLRSI